MGYIAIIDGEEVPVKVDNDEGGNTVVTVGDREVTADVFWARSDLVSLIIDGRSYQVDIHSEKDSHNVLIEGERFEFDLFDERQALLRSSASLGTEGIQEIRASMPGRIVKILVAEGDEVQDGDGLLVVEAMKMENEIKSPKTGVVKKIGVKEGATVEAGELLAVVE
ncbi:MAG TPA: biotin/lipoyl-binding protein [Proteobacteria bacterium]|nr:2-oxoglutarate carboxylase large subunit [bacterium BMS3Abin14]HDL52373.1 biotin/lipoyl-binding protein [Pseudomonadota bacterium]